MAERKSIFITGAGSGIGRAVAQRFAREGWFVGLADIDAGGLAATAALLPTAQCSQHPLDVRDRAAWDAALAGFAGFAGGRIDVVHNNAGVPLGGSIEQAGTDEVERTVDVNLKGVIFGAQAALPWLAASAPGSCLLNTASAAGLYGAPGTAIYAATKFGVRALTEALDVEWAERGIKVRDLMPGFIDTPLLDHAPNRASNDQIRGRVREAGLEITPVADVADAAWAAVHGDKLHTLVGKTAHRLAFASRWMPGRLRKELGKTFRPMGG